MDTDPNIKYLDLHYCLLNAYSMVKFFYNFRSCPPPILQHSGSPPAQIRHANSDIFPLFATELQAFFVLFKILRKLTTYYSSMPYGVKCRLCTTKKYLNHGFAL